MRRDLSRVWAHFDFDMFYIACELLEQSNFVNVVPKILINLVRLALLIVYYALRIMWLDSMELDLRFPPLLR